MPFWTAQIFSGFPFLGDLQTGAWYPLNWPFFAFGIHPKSLFWEEWLHALLAGSGAYLLGFRLVRDEQAALFGAMAFAFCGFQMAHAEHVALVQAAAWLPFAIFLALWTGDQVSARRLACCGIAGGCIALTGHFQIVLYVMSAVWLVTLGRLWGERERWKAVLAGPAAMALAMPLVGAIQILPSMELLRESLRSQLAAVAQTHGTVDWRTLLTFLYPDAVGTFDANFRDRVGDISQTYFYSGVLLLPLAIWGLRNGRARRPALLLIAPALLYALGPAGGVYFVLVHVPGFASVRSPAHGMVVVTLGLAILAAAGTLELRRMLGWRWLIPALCLMSFADLFFWNMWRSATVFERKTEAETLEASERWFRSQLALPLPAGERVAMPGRWVYFYPSMAPFSLPVEMTVGENAFLLTRYYDFEKAMATNRRLMDELSVGRYFGEPGWTVYENTRPMPRFTFPGRLERVSPGADEARRLATLDPRSIGLIETGSDRENPAGTVQVEASGEDWYRMRVECPRECVMRAAAPFYPGWRADVDGLEKAVFPVDRALMGIAIPAGSHRVRLRYRSTYFAWGAAVSGCSVLVLLLGVIGGARRAK